MAGVWIYAELKEQGGHDLDLLRGEFGGALFFFFACFSSFWPRLLLYLRSIMFMLCRYSDLGFTSVYICPVLQDTHTYTPQRDSAPDRTVEREIEPRFEHKLDDICLCISTWQLTTSSTIILAVYFV